MFFRELDLASVLSPVSAAILIVLTKIVIVILGVYAVIATLGTIAGATSVASEKRKGAAATPLSPLPGNRPAAMI